MLHSDLQQTAGATVSGNHNLLCVAWCPFLHTAGGVYIIGWLSSDWAGPWAGVLARCCTYKRWQGLGNRGALGRACRIVGCRHMHRAGGRHLLVGRDLSWGGLVWRLCGLCWGAL